MRSETEYYLRRASEEAYRAIRSEGAEAADVHEALSVRYSAKALILLEEEDERAISCGDSAEGALSR